MGIVNQLSLIALPWPRESRAPVAVLSLPPVDFGLLVRETGGAREAVGTNSKTRYDGAGGGRPESATGRWACLTINAMFDYQ